MSGWYVGVGLANSSFILLMPPLLPSLNQTAHTHSCTVSSSA